MEAARKRPATRDSRQVSSAEWACRSYGHKPVRFLRFVFRNIIFYTSQIVLEGVKLLIRLVLDRLALPMIDVARFSSRVGEIDPKIRERRSFMVFRYFTYVILILKYCVVFKQISVMPPINRSIDY